jgi:short-subunit dehydrogenase
VEKTQKTIIVTGGTKGIGLALVRRFASAGFSIITCSRNEEELLKLKNSIEEEFDTSVNVFAADLSIRSELDGFLDFIKLVGKPIDVLINNTGVFLPGEILKEEEGSLEKMINTNLYSAYHLTRGIVPEMEKRQTGHVFNMCSIASIMAYPNGGSYSISKYAMYGMSKVLREELKESGVRVTAVLPGATLTSSWDGVDLPKERFIDVEDVAELVFVNYQVSNRTVVEEILIRPQLGDI